MQLSIHKTVHNNSIKKEIEEALCPALEGASKIQF